MLVRSWSSNIIRSLKAADKAGKIWGVAAGYSVPFLSVCLCLCGHRLPTAACAFV